jgi:beta-glucanase (GH16 family)
VRSEVVSSRRRIAALVVLTLALASAGGSAANITSDEPAADFTTDIAGPDTGNNAHTAAQAHGWGRPTRDEEFTGDLSGWSLYDSVGHAGNGTRTPSAATVSGGVLTISGDANGDAEGMAWNPGVTYGRWEARMRAPVADKDYHAVLLLWPDSENWPDDGEVDFMENSDPTRRRTEFFLHFGNGTEDGAQLMGAVNVDATRWHNWAVEWAPDHITAYLDGKRWWTTTDAAALPPGPMHMTVQLDLFRTPGGLTPSSMQVDWVHYYPITGRGPSPAPVNAAHPPPPG